MKTQPILTEDNKLSFTLVNGSRVLSLPADPATVRGYSAVSMILLDEAAQVDDAYYSAIQPMLAVSHGQLILMSTPFGKTGFFFREWVSGGDYWKRYQVTATDCPRISEEFLMQQKQSQGELFYRQEYLCEFVDTETQTFKHELLTSAIDETIEPLEL
jgi:hypothetical protein